MNVNKIVKVHKVLSDKTRWEICNAIWEHPGLSGKELLVEFKITQPTLSFHLAKLEEAGVIQVKKEGQSHYYYPNVSMLEDMLKYGQQALALVKKAR